MSKFNSNPVVVESSGKEGKPFRRSLQAGTVLLLLILPFFLDSIPILLGFAAFGAGTLIVLYWYIGTVGWEQTSLGFTGVIWVYVAIWALAGHLLLAENFNSFSLVYVASIGVMIMVSSADYVDELIFHLIISLLLIHALTTIIFYFVPTIFESFATILFDETTGLSYRTSLTSNSGYNAMYCALGLILVSVHLMRDGHPKRRTRLLWFFFLIFSFSLLLTAKRAHPLYALIAIGITFSFLKLSNKSSKVLASLLVGVPVLYLLSITSEGVTGSFDRFLQTFESEDIYSATSGRTLLWEESVLGWRNAPLTGNGWGSFHYKWPDGSGVSSIAHNEALNTLYEGGLIGTLLLFSAIIASLRVPFHLIRSSVSVSDSQWVFFASISFSIQLFLLLYSFTGGELMSKAYTFVPYLLATSLGFLASNKFEQERKLLGESASV